MAISERFLEELKYKSDVVQMVSSYVTLKRAGRNLVGLCPFHNEKSPSFTVYPDNQSFYCFGCGAGGDIISFIKRIENLEYIEAVKLLADRAGMHLPTDDQDERVLRLRGKILEINREAARFYYHMLTGEQGRNALSYLRSRGLLDATITRFGLGYARESWDDLLRHMTTKGYSEEELLAANLCGRGKNNGLYDQFRNRIIFPIIDLRGNVVAFGGRDLGERGPKYLNSSDTPVFSKSRTLYALNIAKGTKEKRMILAEGYMDVVAIHQGGFDNAVASLGTALTAEHARLISSYVGEVVIAYDSDEAGQKATKRAISVLEPTGMHIKVLKMEGAKDPDEFIKKFGSARFRMLLDGSSNSTEYELAKTKARYDTDTADGRVSYLKEACTVLSEIKSPVEREVYASRLAEELGIQRQAIDEQIKGILEKRRRSQDKKQRRDVRVMNPVQSGMDTINPQRQANLKAAIAEESLIAMLMKHPDYLELIDKTVTPDSFVTEFNRLVFERVTERIRESGQCSLTALSGQFTDAQISRIAWILAQSAIKNFSREDAQQNAEALKRCKSEKTPEQVAKLAGAELEEFVKSLNAKKR